MRRHIAKCDCDETVGIGFVRSALVLRFRNSTYGRHMLFQVILPTYNASRWFAEALSSVSGHPHGEVLVIDDGSRDDERQKIEDICRAHTGVKFFAEPRRGLVGTLNFGLSISTARFIARMDADDLAFPNRFDKQIALLTAQPEIALVGGQMIGIDCDGKLNGKRTTFPSTPREISRYLASDRNPFMHPSVMLRRDAVFAVGGYRTATEYAEDFDLWLRLDERYPLANIDEPLIYYRRHENQVTRSTNWKHKFARDLASLSSRRRRALKHDPVDDISEYIFGMDTHDISDTDIINLLNAYKAIESRHVRDGVSADAIHSILSTIDAGLMGRSSKSRAKAAARAVQFALHASNIPLAARALGKGLRLNPIAFVSSLID